MEIHLVTAELFHADGHIDTWTDMTELIVAFSNFAKASKNLSFDTFHLNNEIQLRHVPLC
jgi:hypothetical protein